MSSAAADKRAKFLAAVVKDLKAAGRGSAGGCGSAAAGERPRAGALDQSIAGQRGASAYTQQPSRPNPDWMRLKALAGEMTRGQVSTLVILGGNPAYTAPADLQFTSALAKVANSIHLGLERTKPRRRRSGTARGALSSKAGAMRAAPMARCAIQQPMIEPMYGGRTPAEMVALMLDTKDTRPTTSSRITGLAQLAGKGNDREQAWRKALNDGVIASVKPREAVKVFARREESGGGGCGRAQSLRRAESKLRSFPARRPGTAGSPTTPGCRKRRTR